MSNQTSEAATPMRFHAGQEVLLVPSMNARGSRDLERVRIERVARKYVYVTRYGREAAFDAETGIERVRIAAGSAERIVTPEQHAENQRHERAVERLRELGFQSATYGRIPYSAATLERVIDALEAD